LSKRAILNSFHTLAEERIGEVFRVRLDVWEATDCAGDLAAAIEDFDGRRAGSLTAELGHFCEVLPFLEHTERCAESKVTDYVEGQIVEPFVQS
jgi:hypothetical protein